MSLESRLSRLRAQAGAIKGSVPFIPGIKGTDPFMDPFIGEYIAEGVIRIRQRVPLAGTLGSVELAAVHDKPRLPGETGSQRRNVYIDTETTGLSGGSGTLAFLLGVATVDDDAIEVTQWLMTRFAAEAAALSAFAKTLTDTDRLVSYNGKSYDLPLLISRFRMQGLQPAFETLAHLDLLHPVRRLFGKRWNDCRLLSVEEQLLGFRRVDDLPGSEAPAAWFRYLREGQAQALIKVVEHNRQDILSLAVAHNVLAQAIAQPQAFNIDLHALARWLCESDNEDQARTLLQENTTRLCADGKRLLAHLLRRAGHWSQAVAIWETLAASGCLESIERLAKYHEHISKDLGAAQRCCDRLPPTPAIQHRRQRINRKLNAARHPLLMHLMV